MVASVTITFRWSWLAECKQRLLVNAGGHDDPQCLVLMCGPSIEAGTLSF